jgi:predicted dehydrogenase
MSFCTHAPLRVAANRFSGLFAFLTALSAVAFGAEPMRVGIIGLDTSHVVAFTTAIQKAEAGSPLADLRVVAAYPGGSPDVEASATRVEGFTKTLREAGVEIVDSIDALLPKVDAVFLESVDGRPHLEQARPLFAANKTAQGKKPLFIDKPIAASLADTLEIFRLAEESGTPCFSSSSLRYYSGIAAVKGEGKFGDVVGCLAYGPCSLEPHHPDLFWYGIHGVEILFTIMGTGCRSVTCSATEGTHVVTGVWSDGRIGTFRGVRDGKAGYGAFVFGTKAAGPTDSGSGGYVPLLNEITKFFRTGKPPVSAAETTELVAFMQAADESKRQGGKSVLLADVMQQARSQAAAK